MNLGALDNLVLYKSDDKKFKKTNLIGYQFMISSLQTCSDPLGFLSTAHPI